MSRAWGPRRFHGGIAALVIDIGMGDKNIGQPGRIEADLGHVGQDILCRIVSAARIDQHGRLVADQKMTVDHAMLAKCAFDAMDAGLISMLLFLSTGSSCGAIRLIWGCVPRPRAAVHFVVGSRDKTGLVRGQEEEDVGHFVNGAHPPDGVHFIKSPAHLFRVGLLG